HKSSSASRAQNFSGRSIDSRYIRRYWARFLIGDFCANSFDGLKTRFSLRSDSMLVRAGLAALSIFITRRNANQRRLTAQPKDSFSFLVVLICQRPKSEDMSEHIYKKIELVGSSPNGIEDAVKNALARAKKTMRNMRWFE